MTFNEPEVVRDTAGRFGEKPQSDAEVRLADTFWVYEGDDHEAVALSASSESEAAETARSVLDVQEVLLAGEFRGEPDGYSDEAEYVPRSDTSRSHALRALQNAL